jgi:hypothetical protein
VLVVVVLEVVVPFSSVLVSVLMELGPCPPMTPRPKSSPRIMPASASIPSNASNGLGHPFFGYAVS